MSGSNGFDRRSRGNTPRSNSEERSERIRATQVGVQCNAAFMGTVQFRAPWQTIVRQRVH
jgi:hypothetical protein